MFQNSDSAQCFGIATQRSNSTQQLDTVTQCCDSAQCFNDAMQHSEYGLAARAANFQEEPNMALPRPYCKSNFGAAALVGPHGLALAMTLASSLHPP